jgi:hypothetical protein
VNNALKKLATPTGFEPVTLRLGSRGRLSQIKGHSDSSRHVHPIARQSLKARVRTAQFDDFSVGCGQLSRCIPCIKAEAARARDARDAAEARVAETKTGKSAAPAAA